MTFLLRDALPIAQEVHAHACQYVRTVFAWASGTG